MMLYISLLFKENPVKAPAFFYLKQQLNYVPGITAEFNDLDNELSIFANKPECDLCFSSIPPSDKVLRLNTALTELEDYPPSWWQRQKNLAAG